MSLLSISLESKPKFLVTLALVLWFFATLYLVGVLFIFDVGSTRYIQTEFDLLKYRNIDSAVRDNIAQIQHLRLSIPVGLAQSAGTISLALTIAGGLCFFVGVFEQWNESQRERRKQQVVPGSPSPRWTLIAECFWVIGLSLIVVGATKLHADPLGTLVTGIILLAITVPFKAWNGPAGSNRRKS